MRARRALQLEAFNYTIERRSGKPMAHIDTLSRNPLPVCILSECKNNLTRIRKTQRKDAHLHDVIKLADPKVADGFVVRAGLLFKIIATSKGQRASTSPEPTQ